MIARLLYPENHEDWSVEFRHRRIFRVYEAIGSSCNASETPFATHGGHYSDACELAREEAAT